MVGNEEAHEAAMAAARGTKNISEWSTEGHSHVRTKMEADWCEESRGKS